MQATADREELKSEEARTAREGPCADASPSPSLSTTCPAIPWRPYWRLQQRFIRKLQLLRRANSNDNYQPSGTIAFPRNFHGEWRNKPQPTRGNLRHSDLYFPVMIFLMVSVRQSGTMMSPSKNWASANQRLGRPGSVKSTK